VDAEAQAPDLIISMARSRTYTVRGMPPLRVDDGRAQAAAHPGAGHVAQPLAGRMAPVNPYDANRGRPLVDEDADAAGLAMRSAGGSVEISAEAMAQSMAPAVPAPPAAPSEPVPPESSEPQHGEAPSSDLDADDTDSSSDGGQSAPDLGESVL